jgi:hypothetical protein
VSSAWTQSFYHTAFSTKRRANLTSPPPEARRYAPIGGSLRELRSVL